MQFYGMISLEYSKDHKRLTNSKNRLKFNVFNNIQKEYLTLQLEDILTPKKNWNSWFRNYKFFNISNKKTK